MLLQMNNTCIGNIEISIIIPVYNAEKYLSQCIESILNQLYSNFEIILINDGSTDNSSILCEEYSQKDTRIRYYKQRNKGVSSARNLGIKHAIGKWIIFVDADDKLLSNTLLNICKITTNINVDFICGGYDYLVNNKIQPVTSALKYSDCSKSKEDGISQMYRNEFWAWFICSKVFRRSIIEYNQLLFNESIYFGEDRLFILEYLCRIKQNVYFTSTPLYIYRIHAESVQGKAEMTFDEKMLTGFKASILMYNEMSNSNLSIANKRMAVNDIAISYQTMTKLLHKVNAPKISHKIIRKLLIATLPFHVYIRILIKEWGIHALNYFQKKQK